MPKICKKLLLNLALFLTLYLFVKSNVQADFGQDYQGFLKLYDAYRVAHGDYVTTRNQYLTYGTLNSQNDALNSVKKFLIARDDVLLSYVSLLKSKNTDSMYTPLLDTEEKDVTANKEKIPAVSSLEDAVTTAREIEKQDLPYQTNSRKIVGTLLLHKVADMRETFIKLTDQADSLIQALKSQGKDTSTLERWLLEAKNKALLAEQKSGQVRDLLAKLGSGNSTDLTEDYNKTQFGIFEAQQYLREAGSFLNELGKALTYGNY